MDSPQSVVSPFKNLTVSGAEPEKPRSEALVQQSSSHLSNGTDENNEVKVNTHNPENFIGTLDVFVHQARDIQNICIYHKQDVYAKLCLTSDPETAVSTQTINGGGKNPVFNQSIRLNVRNVESSLKCEIWMLSRVRNYLEDQLLGFTLVPLSEIFIQNGKLEKEFTLSSTDLFHSPSGFVQMSLSYFGASPEVMEIPKLPMDAENAVKASEAECDPSDLDKIEFPDPTMVNENEMMISEYFGMSLESQTTESLVSSDTESHELGVRIVESFSANSEESKPVIPNADSPPSSVSTDGSPSVCLPTSSQSSEAPVTSKSPSDEHYSPLKDQKTEEADGESKSSNGVHKPSKEPIVTPLITVNVEPEEKMVQQDIVDMYMKSMQQFNESLAKMKLPMDLEPKPSKSENSSSDQKSETPKSAGSRVFYGSRAFF